MNHKTLNKINRIIDFKSGLSITTEQIEGLSDFLSDVLNSKGINENDKISLFAENSPYWIVFEKTIQKANAISVLRGSSCPFAELDYIYDNSDSVAVITDSADIVRFFVNKELKFIIYYGEENIAEISSEKVLQYTNEALSSIKPDFSSPKKIPEDKIASILYTSGTSGKPKGVVLKNSSFLYQIEELKKCIPINGNGCTVSVLPIWHSGPKIYNSFFYESGLNIVFAPFEDYFSALKEYQPSYLHCVPRVLSAIKNKYLDIASKKNIAYKLGFNLFYPISHKYKKTFRKNRNGYTNSSNNKNIFSVLTELLLYLPDKFAETIFYKPLTKFIFNNTPVIITGGARIQEHLLDFFDVMNIKIICGYGLTETAPLVTHDLIADTKFYSSGYPFEGTEIKILDIDTNEEIKNGESGIIAVKGPQLMLEYYNNNTATNDVFTKDGFLKTGDVGFISKEGFLTVVCRYDDVAALLNGINIELPPLEDECKKLNWVNDIIIIGDGLPFLVSIININQIYYEEWCKNNNISKYPNKNNHNEFKSFILSELNKQLSKRETFQKYDKIKNIFFSNETFANNSKFTTNTSKIKRNKIVEYYKSEIINMYKEIELQNKGKI